MKNLKFRINKNVVNLYDDPDSTVLATQAVFGDVVTLIELNPGSDLSKLTKGRFAERGGEFYLVEGRDGYRGWVSRRHLSPIDETLGGEFAEVCTLITSVYSDPDLSAPLVTRLPLGARVRHHRQLLDSPFVGLTGGNGWVLLADLAPPTVPLPKWLSRAKSRALEVKQIGTDAVRTAMRLIGTPYLLGGCTPFAIDCSALVQLSYRLNGVELLRDACLQIGDPRFVEVPSPNGFSSAFEDGDLLFFGHGATIDHVGLALVDGRFIDSSGRMDYGCGVSVTVRSNASPRTGFLKAMRLSGKGKVGLPCSK